MQPIINIKPVKNIITKTGLPVGQYAANTYVGCTHACKYCYACYMKRFTGHREPWGTFLDVKMWEPIAPHVYDNCHIMLGSVTDCYNQYESKYRRTRTLLQELSASDNVKIDIVTKSDLVVEDLELLSRFDTTVAFSINTLDEQFRSYMDSAKPIAKRIEAMKTLHSNGIKTACFISPIFPGITNIVDIIETVKYYTNSIWLENLNLRHPYKSHIMGWIRIAHPELWELYKKIYDYKDITYWNAIEREIAGYARITGMPYFVNDLPNWNTEPGKPMIVNYFHHEKIRR